MSTSLFLKNLRSLNVICTRNLLFIKHYNVSHKAVYARTVVPNITCVAPLLKRNMAQANITNIGFEELKNHQKLGTLIIDVREPEEIAETGVLPDGINVPLGEICAALSKAPHDFETKYGRKMPEKGDDIVFSCRSGKRSAQ
uniref:Rhodanese domain-containing protein n=3 Tax=Rhodnius prolixus TaxID=13249 RepID=T1HUD5_RHOPR